MHRMPALAKHIKLCQQNVNNMHPYIWKPTWDILTCGFRRMTCGLGYFGYKSEGNADGGKQQDKAILLLFEKYHYEETG